MFEKFSDSAISVLQSARDECVRLTSCKVDTAHVLIALTEDYADVASRALASMGIDKALLQREVERARTSASKDEAKPQVDSGKASEEPALSDALKQAVRESLDQGRYFGQEEVKPEHLLLGIMEGQGTSAAKLLEELGANLTFLRRQVMALMAEDCCFHQTAPSLRFALLNGLTDLISQSEDAVDCLSSLSTRTGVPLRGMPSRTDIVYLVSLSYMPEFLATQVAFQRYLLEESMKLLSERTGPLDEELTATIVSNGAQHLLSEVRSTIEYLWSTEYRLFDFMLDEGEHDLIGSVIEDLWWAQSEEIALHKLFDSALEDHRRKQVLSLQKRRIEISQRLTRLTGRLAETIRQCFVRRSISA
ncbi:MAG: hypothetical protein HY711_07595 [Candidatus Melainabacteria bacterium]|nr:hypothetical protein [Candidatus Melainabacteria bacterium]